MTDLIPAVLLVSLLAATQAGEYCDNFEPSGDFGSFWHQVSEDSSGKWEPTSYTEIQKTIPDFPAPASGDTIMYLALPPKGGSTASARMETVQSFKFPNGSSISFRYWIRSTYAGAATLYATLASGTHEKDMIIDLSPQSSPHNTDWNEVSVPIVTEENLEYQIMIFATHAVANNTVDNIAIDDIIISGPDGLPDRDCEVTTTTITPTTSTTTEPSTTEPTTTEPTTTEPTTAEPTTTEPTTTEPTTTEPTTTEPTTTEPTTAEPTTTTAESTTVTVSPTTVPVPASTVPPPTPPSAAGGDRYGSSALLWVVFVVLGTSVALALVLALTRKRRRPDDQQLLETSSSSSSSRASGWYHYVTDDRWTRLHGRLKRLWE